MGPNLERVRSLLRALGEADPDADVRRRLISGHPAVSRGRARAVALLSAELVRDPHELMTGDPPDWLVDLSRTSQTGATLLFDGRLTDLSARAVDDLLSQGCTSEELVIWLEERRRAARRRSPD